MRIASVFTDRGQTVGFERDGRIIVFSADWAEENRFPTSLEQLLGQAGSDLERVQGIVNSIELHQTPGYVHHFDPRDVQFAPSVPMGKKIICVGLNYKKHADESNMDLPKVPLLFSKYDNTLVGHNAEVKRPLFTEQMDFEAEVGVVIGKTARNVSVETALDYVFGYTNANDLSARDAQFITSQWLVGKTCDGFCPVGPYLVTSDEIPDPSNLRVRCSVNGHTRQDASTSQMIFSFAELISYISHRFTLEPGDLILSGTPDGVIFGLPQEKQVWLQPGDEVVVDVEGLSQLRTIVG